MTEPLESVAIPMLEIVSDPLPMPSEMFTMLGEIVVLWSRIEASIDSDIQTMMYWPVVRQLVQRLWPKGRPTAFSKKLMLWRRCIATLYPKVEVYQAQASEFKRVATITAKLRNHIIHGSWSLQPTENGGFDVWSIRPIFQTANADRIEVTSELLAALLNDMRTLDNYIVSFVSSRMWHQHIGLLKVDRGSGHSQ